jgi:hypothetical protein
MTYTSKSLLEAGTPLIETQGSNLNAILAGPLTPETLMKAQVESETFRNLIGMFSALIKSNADAESGIIGKL